MTYVLTFVKKKNKKIFIFSYYLYLPPYRLWHNHNRSEQRGNSGFTHTRFDDFSKIEESESQASPMMLDINSAYELGRIDYFA